MSIVVDKPIEHLRKYNDNFQWAKDNYDDLYCKYKNEFVAIVDHKVIHDKDLDKLLNNLRIKEINPCHTFIHFIRDKTIRII